MTTDPTTPTHSGAYFNFFSPAALYIEIKKINSRNI